jgi:hypothetical protein
MLMLKGQSKYQLDYGRWERPQSFKRSLLNMLLSALGSHQIFISRGRVQIAWLARSTCEKYLQCQLNSIWEFNNIKK